MTDADTPGDMDELKSVYLQGPRSDFVELARKPSKTGKLFRKHLLPFGSFVHPNDPKKKLTFTRDMADKLITNFNNGVVDIVQTPVVDEKNRHVEDPFRNIGEVVDLTVEDDGVYATLDARKRSEDVGQTLLGISAMMSLDYTDTKTGQKVGPTLLHAAYTNRPYIANLREFQEIIAASADTPLDEAPVVLTEEEEEVADLSEFSKEDILAVLRDEHDVDVEALQAKAEAAEQGAPSAEEFAVALSRVLKEAAPGTIQFAGSGDEGEEIGVRDVADAVIELSNEKIELDGEVKVLKEENERRAQAAAEAEVDANIRAGKIIPKQRDAMVKLAREDRETYEALLPDDSIIEMSEHGIVTHEDPDSEEYEKAKEEVQRLVKLAAAERGEGVTDGS